MKNEDNQTIQEADYSVIEKHYACPLSADIRSFQEKYNGDIVEPEYGIEITFVTDEGKSVKDYFPVINHTKEIIKQLQLIDYIEDFPDESNWGKNEIEADKLLPVMSVNGGSVNLYIAVCGAQEGKLFVVDNGDYGVSKVSLTLAELIKQLGS